MTEPSMNFRADEVPSQTTSLGTKRKDSSDVHKSSDQPPGPTKKKSKSRAEYQRQYRARRSSRDGSKLNKDIGVEYQRRYRARKKIEVEKNRFENLEKDLPTIAPGNEPSMTIEQPFTSSDTICHRRLIQEGPQLPYSRFSHHKHAHAFIKNKFISNPFGFSCSICDRLWFQYDLSNLPANINKDLLDRLLPGIAAENVKICAACASGLRANKIPTYAVYNGFKYSPLPPNLPSLDVITERLISPRIPFIEIKRLRHINGQFGIFGQIINVPVNVNTMVNRLPRDLAKDYSINVHIEKRKIHKSSYIQGLVNKRTVREWLTFLRTTPLYNDIVIDPEFLAAPVTGGEMPNDDVSEEVFIEDSLVAQQQTLLWNESQYLRLAPEENSVQMSLLLDNHAEELSFPGIYLGQMRKFRDGIQATHYQMASSEIRRTDRRGVAPRHLLYMAAKNMRIRVSSALTSTLKFIGVESAISKEQIQSEEYINKCLTTNLAFLKNIPNSAYYWARRKKDLFSMIRQLGRPTIVLTMSANETGWIPLLQLLQRMKDGKILSEEEATNLNWFKKCTLVNEDAVTCAIYFDKLINTIMTVLQSKKICPFGQHRVTNYFKRIEFHHRGSPHAHIFAWLDNSPQHPLGGNMHDSIALIDSLISVSTSEASGNIELQTHKHTFICYKRLRAHEPKKCRFEAPFLPSRYTQILAPMQKEEPRYRMYADRYKQIKSDYEVTDYDSIDDFYERNNILSDEDYCQILRAGITRPRAFLKRAPIEKWHNPFNPFILHHLRSYMDIQFILDEVSCATYVVDYVNKASRGVSNLQQKILEVSKQYPDFGMVEITKKMSIDFLNAVEMSSQEAAWWLLRKPMSEASELIIFIPTTWPDDRQRFKKAQRESALLDDDSTNIWKESIFEKYEQRPQTLDHLTLAQFGAQYMRCSDGQYKQLKKSRIIRYIQYNLTTHLNDYKREMVLLHIPFRNENEDILAESKFLQIYTDNEHIILERRRQFESNTDIQETLRLCRELIREEEVFEQANQENQRIPGDIPESPPF